jgi:hypothetical protein
METCEGKRQERRSEATEGRHPHSVGSLFHSSVPQSAVGGIESEIIGESTPVKDNTAGCQ